MTDKNRNMPFQLDFYNARRRNKASGYHKRAFSAQGWVYSVQRAIALDGVRRPIFSNPLVTITLRAPARTIDYLHL